MYLVVLYVTVGVACTSPPDNPLDNIVRVDRISIILVIHEISEAIGHVTEVAHTVVGILIIPVPAGVNLEDGFTPDSSCVWESPSASHDITWLR